MNSPSPSLNVGNVRPPVAETAALLQQVETGEFNGIGSQLVALGSEIQLPDGLARPERDNGRGWISKYLGKAALDSNKEIGLDLKVFSPVENGKIVDTRLLAWLLIGRNANSELGSEGFVFSAEQMVARALRTTAEITQQKLLQGAKRPATNWRSLFEGLVKADIFGADFQPTIITSLGGFDGEVPLAAPFNIVPGLELAQTLRSNGYEPSMTVTSAAKYGVDCNGLDLSKASNNWDITLDAYRRIADRFYPELAEGVAYETLWPGGIDTYPPELVEAARECCEADDSLRQTAEQYGAGSEAFVRYMLSHTQAFRDFQSQPEAPFAIKVGAPSELRFSQWQKQVIERALPNLPGIVPNMTIRNDDDYQYGQISLYYRRLGNRPPYYPDSDTEPVLGGSYPTDYLDFLYTIPDDDPSLARYADLQNALELTRIKPTDYLDTFVGVENE